MFKVYSVCHGVATAHPKRTNSKPVALKLGLVFAKRVPVSLPDNCLKVRAFVGRCIF